MLVAPPALLHDDAAGRGAAALQPDAVGPRPVAGKVFRERHLHGGDEIDHLADVLALGGVERRGNGAGEQQAREQQEFETPEHLKRASLVSIQTKASAGVWKN